MGKRVPVRKGVVEWPLSQHPEIVSGAVVFEDTRLPVTLLFDYLCDDRTVDDFLEDYPFLDREKAIGALRLARRVLSGVPDDLVV